MRGIETRKYCSELARLKTRGVKNIRAFKFKKFKRVEGTKEFI